MHCLFLTQHDELKKSIPFLIESEFEGITTSLSSPHEAIAQLLGENPIDLILLEENESGLVLLKYLATVGSKIPCILFDYDDKETQQPFPELNILARLKKKSLLDEMEKQIQIAFKRGIFTKQDSKDAYCRIPTELLIKVAPLEADVYLRLSQIKYIKVFKASSIFTLDDLEKYLFKKKIDYLYLLKSEAPHFVEKLKSEIQKIIPTFNELPTEKRLELNHSYHEAMIELSDNLGFTPAVQEMAKETITVTLKSIGQNPKLSELAAYFVKEKDKYISAHSMMLAYISCGLAAQMKWSSQGTYAKLTYASFFHDFSLKNHKLAQIDTLKELDNRKNEFSLEEFEGFRKHPMTAADMLINFPELPPDTDNIIRQHHEKPDGSGFPRGLTVSYISPLVSLFIVSHDLVQFIFKNNSLNIKNFLDQYPETYRKGNFKKVFDTLEKGL